jgi:YesN/AraC family two-component response regulator
MIEITEDNFKDPVLSLTTVAQALSYNPKYLSHAFKESMGVGYAEYLRSIRIRFAVSLLDLGIDSIKNVALLSGFTDPLYFSTVFKKSLEFHRRNILPPNKNKRLQFATVYFCYLSSSVTAPLLSVPHLGQ